ncbi:MAG: hypothetical protein FWH47_01605 [Methanomassiliicoccaceae archaeon]|nr:hypothetical protein [Methanomassiliicoccaceae archaeon]
MRERVAAAGGRAKRPVDAGEGDTYVPLKFSKNDKGVMSSSYGGRKVYIREGCGDAVGKDGVWMCMLSNHEKDGCAYATPITELDGEFFMGLNQKWVRVMADSLWETKRDMVVSALGQEAVSRLDEEVKALRKELSEKAEEIKLCAGVTDGVNRFEEKARIWRDELGAKDARITDLEAKVSDAARKAKAAEASRREISELKEELTRLRSVEDNANRLSNDNWNLERDLKGERAIAADLKKRVTEVEQKERDIDALKKEIAGLKKDSRETKRDAEADAERSREEIERLKSEIRRRDATISMLEEAGGARASDEEARTLKGEVSRRDAIIEGLRAELAERGRTAPQPEPPAVAAGRDGADMAERELRLKMEIMESLVAIYERRLAGNAGAEGAPRPRNDGIFGDAVLHTGADEIYSGRFRAGRYDVAVSADGGVLTVKESERGKVACNSGVLSLPGLERFLPFKERGELRATVRENMLVIDLKGAQA